MKTPPAAGLLVAAVLTAAIAVVLWAAIRGMGKDQDVAGEIDRTVMAEYGRLVGAGEFAKAWESCLAASYREEVPREKFVAAHEKRRAAVGALGGVRLLRSSLHHNLFSKRRELQLLYELTYPGGVKTEYATVSDADGSWRIEGTYHMGAGETLDFLLW